MRSTKPERRFDGQLPLFISKQSAAWLASVSTDKIDDNLKFGRLKKYRIGADGRGVFIDRCEFINFLENGHAQIDKEITNFPILLSKKDAAWALDVSSALVEVLIRRGALPIRKQGRKVLVKTRDVISLMKCAKVCKSSCE